MDAHQQANRVLGVHNYNWIIRSYSVESFEEVKTATDKYYNVVSNVHASLSLYIHDEKKEVTRDSIGVACVKHSIKGMAISQSLSCAESSALTQCLMKLGYNASKSSDTAVGGDNAVISTAASSGSDPSTFSNRRAQGVQSKTVLPPAPLGARSSIVTMTGVQSGTIQRVSDQRRQHEKTIPVPRTMALQQMSTQTMNDSSSTEQPQLLHDLNSRVSPKSLASGKEQYEHVAAATNGEDISTDVSPLYPPPERNLVRGPLPSDLYSPQSKNPRSQLKCYEAESDGVEAGSSSNNGAPFRGGKNIPPDLLPFGAEDALAIEHQMKRRREI